MTTRHNTQRQAGAASTSRFWMKSGALGMSAVGVAVMVANTAQAADASTTAAPSAAATSQTLNLKDVQKDLTKKLAAAQPQGVASPAASSALPTTGIPGLDNIIASFNNAHGSAVTTTQSLADALLKANKQLVDSLTNADATNTEALANTIANAVEMLAPGSSLVADEIRQLGKLNTVADCFVSSAILTLENSKVLDLVHYGDILKGQYSIFHTTTSSVCNTPDNPGNPGHHTPGNPGHHHPGNPGHHHPGNPGHHHPGHHTPGNPGHHPKTPVTPVHPKTPVTPVKPSNPVTPVKPVTPVTPANPVKPVGPKVSTDYVGQNSNGSELEGLFAAGAFALAAAGSSIVVRRRSQR